MQDHIKYFWNTPKTFTGKEYCLWFLGDILLGIIIGIVLATLFWGYI